jgi:hypothetical protein
MQLFIVATFVVMLLSACTPFIPIKENFGTSAVKATGNIPPEFVEFNRYDPQVDAVVSDQICATPYIRDTEKSLRATPGEFISWNGRCVQYEIRLDNLAQHFTP